MAYIVMAYMLMAYMLMAFIVMAYKVMPYVHVSCPVFYILWHTALVFVVNCFHVVE